MVGYVPDMNWEPVELMEGHAGFDVHCYQHCVHTHGGFKLAMPCLCLDEVVRCILWFKLQAVCTS